ncbi:MAG: transglycosylase SLT domain-containing protein, partial [Desulfobacterales bacterium]
IRSGAVIEEIRDTFRRRHLPVDLAFLPHVESSFHNGAYSKYGAVGIWQFTRATGKRLMTVDDTVDMRLDPIFATRAAAALLKENYRKLGTWPLAITAYNHGVRGVLRAKRRHGDYEGIFSRYRTRRFRFASRNFYPEFLAAREAAGRFRAYFGDIVLNRTEPARITRIPGYALFSDIAGHFQIAPERLSALNPALRPVVVRGSKLVPKGYPLRLPFNEWQTFSSFHAGFPIDNCAEKQLQSAVYRVRSGDTLTAIARVNGIRLSDLISANGLDPGKPLRVNRFSFKRTLRLGESVVIPLDRVKRETFETRRRRYHQSIQDAFFSVHRIESAVVYRVKPGETIWTLSSRVFNLPAWLIQKYNPDVDFGDLRRSQQLLIPVVDQPA